MLKYDVFEVEMGQQKKVLSRSGVVWCNAGRVCGLKALEFCVVLNALNKWNLYFSILPTKTSPSSSLPYRFYFLEVQPTEPYKEETYESHKYLLLNNPPFFFSET